MCTSRKLERREEECNVPLVFVRFSCKQNTIRGTDVEIVLAVRIQVLLRVIGVCSNSYLVHHDVGIFRGVHRFDGNAFSQNSGDRLYPLLHAFLTHFLLLLLLFRQELLTVPSNSIFLVNTNIFLYCSISFAVGMARIGL